MSPAIVIGNCDALLRFDSLFLPGLRGVGHCSLSLFFSLFPPLAAGSG